MMMMKKQTIMLTCFMLLSALTVVATTYSPSECCFSFCPSPLRRRGVITYKHTNNQCPKRGVLFKMRNGKEYCANPSEQWVMDIIAEI